MEKLLYSLNIFIHSLLKVIIAWELVENMLQKLMVEEVQVRVAFYPYINYFLVFL